MKKFISMLLIVAMMATTFAMIFAGTVTAVAEEVETPVISENVSSEDDSIGAKIAAVFVWFINALRNSGRDAGLLSIIIDGIYELVDNQFNISGLMDYLQNSGVVEWAIRNFFPR